MTPIAIGASFFSTDHFFYAPLSTAVHILSWPRSLYLSHHRLNHLLARSSMRFSHQDETALCGEFWGFPPEQNLSLLHCNISCFHTEYIHVLGFLSARLLFVLASAFFLGSSSTAAHDGMNDQPAGNTRGLGHTYILISRRHRNLALLKIARQTVFTHELEGHRRGGWVEAKEHWGATGVYILALEEVNHNT